MSGQHFCEWLSPKSEDRSKNQQSEELPKALACTEQCSSPNGLGGSAKGRLIEKLVQRQHVSLLEFNVMPFGLCNSPSTSQRRMDLILAAVQWATCSADLDDVIVFGRTFQEH